MSEYDAVVVGAGPNGLSAAAELSRRGRRVLVVELAEEIGGGTRTEELTLPGFAHDVCSAIHPLGVGSPFFRDLGLEVEWVHPDIPLAHPLGGGRVGVVERDVEATARRFGDDARHYRRILGPLVEAADAVMEDFLGPMTLVPDNPGSFVKLASRGALPASIIASGFSSAEARGVLAGLAAHAYGWPMVKGGSQRIAEALAKVIVDHGGTIETGRMIGSIDELPEAPVVILDVMPRAAVRIGGTRVGPWERRRLTAWRTGPAVFKVDWALDAPIPWADPWSAKAGTVHVGGSWEDVAAAEDQVHSGNHPERPFVLVAQQSRFDPTRAPEGKHTAWGYCHVPSGSDVDMTEAIERQVERFAPGFRELILERHTMNAGQFEAHNPNYIKGDIAGGGFGVKKVFQLGSTAPYRIGDGLYLCSSATPPGAGVHGMCGYYAARAALKG